MEGSSKTFMIRPTQGKAVDTITIKTLDSITEDVERIDRYIHDGEAKLPEGQSFAEWNFSKIRTHYTITVTFAASKDGETQSYADL